MNTGAGSYINDSYTKAWRSAASPTPAKLNSLGWPVGCKVGTQNFFDFELELLKIGIKGIHRAFEADDEVF